MIIRELIQSDREAWFAMRSTLWPNCTAQHNVTDMHAYFSEGGELMTFVAENSDGRLCGFIEASLRQSAEGCKTRPVGYIEGIFVEPAFRRSGIGRLLVAAVERWAASCGAVEFASDCKIDNEASLHFHQRLGFEITHRLIHFRRTIPS